MVPQGRPLITLRTVCLPNCHPLQVGRWPLPLICGFPGPLPDPCVCLMLKERANVIAQRGVPWHQARAFPRSLLPTMRPCLTPSISEEAEMLDFAKKREHSLWVPLGASEGQGAGRVARLWLEVKGQPLLLDTLLAGFPLSVSALCPIRWDPEAKTVSLAWPMSRPDLVRSMGRG